MFQIPVNKTRLLLPFFLAAIVLTMIFSGCNNGQEDQDTDHSNNGTEEELQEITDTGFFLDTRVEIIVLAADPAEAESAIKSAQEEMEKLEQVLSRHIEGSEIYEINQQAGREPVEVSDITWEVITHALDIGEQMGGYFDITIAPIMKLYGFGEDHQRVPSDEEIDDFLQYVDYNKVELNEEEQTVFLPEPEMELELGGASKGFIVDRATEILAEHDIYSGLVNAGGDINSTREKEPDTPWRIGIRHPRQDDYFAVAELSGDAIATSGDYERYFEEEGERYHHIMNPYTGKPVEGVISSTVFSEHSLQQADLLSTASFGYGIENSLALFEDLDGVEAVMIDNQKEIHMTSGFEEIEFMDQYKDGNLN